MKKSIITLLILVAIGGIVFWLWYSGIIPGAIAGLGAMFAGILGGHEVQREKVQKKADEVDRIIEQMREKDREIEHIRQQHDAEVKRVEENHRDDSIDDLLDSANERERNRTNKTE
jgi:biopolymer transport protein ExbB/TolQ